MRPPERAVESNLGLVFDIAIRHRSRWVPTRDLFQEGTIGLIQAARRFDPGRGKPFAAYAGFWIRKYIREAVFRASCFVHVPYGKRREIGRMPAASSHCPGNPAIHAILPPAEEPNPPAERLPLGEVTAPRIVLKMQPLEENSVGAARAAGESYGASNPMRVDPEEALLRRERSEIVRTAVGSLNSVELEVVSRRFGFGDGEPEPLGGIGTSLGLTRQRVHQIEGRAKKRLRTRLRELGWATD